MDPSSSPHEDLATQHAQDSDHDQAAPHDDQLPDTDDAPDPDHAHHAHHAHHTHHADHEQHVHDHVEHEHHHQHEHDQEHEDIPPHEHHEHPTEHDSAEHHPTADPESQHVHEPQHDPTLDPEPNSAAPHTADGLPPTVSPHPAPEPPDAKTASPPDASVKAAASAAVAAAAEAAATATASPDPNLQDAPSDTQSSRASRRRSAERYHASTDQLRQLVQAFQQDPTPSAATLNFLSSSIDMPMHNMVLWFKNRRARHKKSNHPVGVQPPAKTGRRSYVKSGIYARAPKKGGDAAAAAKAAAAAAQANATAAAAVAAVAAQGEPETDLTHVPMLPDAVEAPTSVSVPDMPVPAAVTDPSANAEPLETGGSAKRPLEDGDGEEEGSEAAAAATKRARYLGVREVVGEANPCRSWDSQECHQRCCAFFVKSTAACHQPEQTKTAVAVSEEFFLGELQSGLTITSAMQGLETSAGVLDAIMDRVREEGQGVRLNSGSRAVMREFIAQVRSGQAVHLPAAEQAEDGGEEADQPNGATAVAAAPE